jgi:hypothetical protein
MNVPCWKHQVLALLPVSLLIGGCPRTITVTATQGICDRPIEVHLVGVPASEKQRWEEISMTDYWRSGNRQRQRAKDYTHVIRFGEGPCERKLVPKHPIRDKWKDRDAQYLLVLAHLPGLFEDSPGNADARRLVIPGPEENDWGNEKEINLVIDSQEVRVLTTRGSTK